MTVPVGIISLFAIWATTLPREKVELNLKMNEVYEMQMSKADFFNSIKAGHGYSDVLEKNLTDSLFYLHFDIVDESRIDVTALSTITSIDSITTKLRLDSILHGYITGGLFSGVDKDDVEHFKSISAQEFKAHFETNFIQPLKNRTVENTYFDNKEIHDSYEKNEYVQHYTYP